MSDTPQGPEWWQASDGKWYAPPRPDWPVAAETVETPQATPPEPVAPPAAVETPAAPPLDPSTEFAPPSAPPVADAPPAFAPTEIAPAVGAPPVQPPFEYDDISSPHGPPIDLPSDAFPPGPPGTGPSPDGDPFGTPAKNRAPLVIGIIVAVIAAVAIGFFVLGGDDDDSVSATDTTQADGPGNKEGDPDPGTPPASDIDPTPIPDPGFPEFVDPEDAEAIVVDESGFVLVPDEFDEGTTNASYGFVITNPNTDLAATSVEVSIGLFDQAGTAVETQSDFVSGLLGEQQIGMGGFIRDVPADVTRIEVTAKASQLIRTGDGGGELTVSEIATAQEEFGGVNITFKVTSSFEIRQENVTLYALFRDGAGKPIGGAQSFLGFVEPGGTSSAEIRSFADVPGLIPEGVEVSVTINASTLFD